MSGEFAGMGTSRLYGRLAGDVVRTCGSLARSALSEGAVRVRRGPDANGDSLVLRRALAVRGYAAGTAAKYASCVSAFLEAVAPRAVEELSAADVERYLAAQKVAEKGNGTLRVQLCALRAVFDRMLGMQITAGIDHAPRPVPIPPAEPEQVKAVMVAARGNPRDRLVVDMLNRTKLRQGVLRLLRTPPGTCPLFTGRAVEERERGCVPPHIVPLEVAEDGAAAIGWLLPSSRGRRPISTRTIRRIVGRYAARCGFSVTCTAIRKATVVPMRPAA